MIWTPVRWVTALTLGVLLHACAQPEESGALRSGVDAQPSVLVTVRFTTAGPELVDAQLGRLQPDRETGRADPLHWLEVRSHDARALAALGLPHPEQVLHVDVPHGAGGEHAMLTESMELFVLPWPADAREVVLSGGRSLVPRPAPSGFETQSTDSSEPEPLHHSGDNAQRYDLVVVGDGYTAAQQGQFRTDAARFSDLLLSYEPFQSMQGRINVWMVPSASAQTGAGTGEAQDTSYGCYLGCAGIDRLICCDRAEVRRAMDPVASADGVLVLVNDSRWGGGGSSNHAASSNQDHRIAVHELGHHIANLADEYEYQRDWEGDEYDRPNCSTSSSHTPWQYWRSADPSVDAYPGCAYNGFYRPTHGSCMMRDVGQPFCSVCKDELAQVIATASRVDTGPPRLLGARPPAGSTVALDDTSFEAEFEERGGYALQRRWQLDGVTVSATNLTERLCTVPDEGTVPLRAEARYTTPWVRPSRRTHSDFAGVQWEVHRVTEECYRSYLPIVF